MFVGNNDAFINISISKREIYKLKRNSRQEKERERGGGGIEEGGERYREMGKREGGGERGRGRKREGERERGERRTVRHLF